MTAFNAAGGGYGFAIVNGKHVDVQFWSGSGGIGKLSGNPIVAVTVSILPGAAAGASATVTADPTGVISVAAANVTLICCGEISKTDATVTAWISAVVALLKPVPSMRTTEPAGKIPLPGCTSCTESDPPMVTRPAPIVTAGDPAPPAQVASVTSECYDVGCTQTGHLGSIPFSASVKTNSGGNWLTAEVSAGAVTAAANPAGLAPRSPANRSPSR